MWMLFVGTSDYFWGQGYVLSPSILFFMNKVNVKKLRGETSLLEQSNVCLFLAYFIYFLKSYRHFFCFPSFSHFLVQTLQKVPALHAYWDFKKYVLQNSCKWDCSWLRFKKWIKKPCIPTNFCHSYFVRTIAEFKKKIVLLSATN